MLKSTSMSHGSSAYQGSDERQRAKGCDQDRVSAEIQRKRGMNVSRRRAAATVSHDSIRNLDPPVAARTREREIKRAGHCRLGIARIGRAGMSGIAHARPAVTLR